MYIFDKISLLFSWMPSTTRGLCVSLFSVFVTYAIVKLIKLLLDILPIA